MLIRLLKFDLKSNAKIQAILIAAVLGMIPLFAIANLFGNSILDSFITIAAIFLSIIAFVGYAGQQVIYFANTMAGRESYFTHTLPAHAYQILLSKLLSSLIWGIAIITSLILCWLCYANIFHIVIPKVLFDMLKPIGFICTFQFIFQITLISFSVSLSVYHKLAGYPRLIVSIVTYFIIYNASGIMMILFMGIQLFLKGELSSFLNNQWPDEKVLDFVHQIFYFISIIYALISAAFYTLSLRVFDKLKAL